MSDQGRKELSEILKGGRIEKRVGKTKVLKNALYLGTLNRGTLPSFFRASGRGGTMGGGCSFIWGVTIRDFPEGTPVPISCPIGKRRTTLVFLTFYATFLL